MYYSTELQQQIKEQVKAQVNKNLSPAKAELILPFVDFIFKKVSDEDLEGRDINDLYGIVLSQWNLLVGRLKPTDRVVHVYNPEFETCGWESKHTIIEVALPNMPFLIDSLRMELTRRGHTIFLLFSPGAVILTRDKRDKVTGFEPVTVNTDADEIGELTIYIEIERQVDQNVLNEIKYHIEFVLEDVSTAVSDWDHMQAQAEDILLELKNSKIEASKKDRDEAERFLSWIIEGHFTFLGSVDYVYNDKDKLVRDKDTALGLARTKKYAISQATNGKNGCDKDVCDANALVWMQQLTEMSTVHRPTRPYCIALKRFDKAGKPIGERRFFGLFTSVAYHSNPANIPLIRHKVSHIIQRAGFHPDEHGGRTLANILETYPRDELFQTSEDDLLDISLGIMHLQERARVRMFMRNDYYDRYVSCLIFVPRDRFNSRLREKMSDILMAALGGDRVDFMTHFSESILARIHLMIYLPHGAKIPEYDPKVLEEKLVMISQTWEDELYAAAIEHFGEHKGIALHDKYKNAFQAGYQEVYSARTAVHDIEHMESLKSETDVGMSFYRPIEQQNGFVKFKLFVLSQSIPLSEVLPLLENMGFKVMAERGNEIRLKDDKTIWISEFSLLMPNAESIDVDAVKENFKEAFARTWRGDAESDDFNALVIYAGLDWREATLLRAYAKYFRQIGFRFSQAYIEETLLLYPDIARMLVKLFHAYFDPHQDEKPDPKAIKEDILKAIDAVSNLDQDRILRCYLASIKATLRTNFYQMNKAGDHKNYVSFKINSSKIPEVPLPLPAFEVFVYSPRVEGVHLRGAKVARGGLRWSDRREDFRTEILGLMKAQQVKNAVIVPAGAKGGFVPKQLPNGTREEIMEEVVNCYTTFIRGLLDITDNRDGDTIVPPKDVVRRDDDDPYLVVAADKGTATFSDIANGVAKEYNFWLGDAFASGGSQGYDHKKMGITAKGAWESVKRHFRELGKNIQEEDFTVAGIGDMSGDVFGNGMLLSEHIQLVAAFNHQHIFVDPTPDASVSFKERQRMFNLPRSSWTDYDESLISKGGGIFRRSAKSIAITPEMKAALAIDADQLTPNELITAILKAPVDLLWNGGIGTYVKAATEQNADVGDRTNDPVRINGQELRCKVIGEGGNLGFTQLGRVEYSLNGGVCYTDFIDNAGGVDCSDHEVNLKILLNSVMNAGDMTEKQRNELLAMMTDEVGKLVLTNNYQQTQAVSLAASRASSTFDEYIRFMHELERIELLKRSLEYLPNDKELENRRVSGVGFTRPEIAILVSYSKIFLNEQLLKSDIVDDPALTPYLRAAFPERVSSRFSGALKEHRLRPEIIATQLANAIVNRMGATYVKRIYDETGATPADVARSFIVSEEVFGMDELWAEIQSLDNKIAAADQARMMVILIRLVRRATRWFLRNRRVGINIDECIQTFKPHVTMLYDHIAELLAGEELKKLKENTKALEKQGVPNALALKVSSCRAMISALDIIEPAIEQSLSPLDVAKVYFAVGATLQLDWFRAKIAAHEVNNNWDALARAACRDDVDRQQRSITESVLHYCKSVKDADSGLKTWQDEHELLVKRWRFMLDDLKSTTSEDFTMYAVALRELLDLAQASQSRLAARKSH